MAHKGAPHTFLAHMGHTYFSVKIFGRPRPYLFSSEKFSLALYGVLISAPHSGPCGLTLVIFLNADWVISNGI